ncbi:MAG: PepSY domain-containing protein [Blautia sp.]|nr:PepSY domain-containing protein [Lachnoclostridium sp.]MCM1210458.1 PepSY domain-containing protein [Blautia sp.]
MEQENSLGNQRKNRRCSIFLCSILTGCLLTVTACANKNPQTAPTGEGKESQPVQDTTATAQTDIGVEQAKSAALSHAGLEASDVTFTKEKLDYDDGRAEYEIEFVTADQKYEYEIQADDGTILNASAEAIERRISNMGTQGSVTLEEAKEIALEHAGLDASQVSYTKLEQDVEDGHTEYEIEFYADGKEYEYTIHGETGKILEAETEQR